MLTWYMLVATLHASMVDTISRMTIVVDKCYIGGGDLGTVGGLWAVDAHILPKASYNCITPAVRLTSCSQSKTPIGGLLPDPFEVTVVAYASLSQLSQLLTLSGCCKKQASDQTNQVPEMHFVVMNWLFLAWNQHSRPTETLYRTQDRQP